MQSTISNVVVAFPKPKKRGRRLRTSPSAVVITLPTRNHAIAAIREATSGVDQMVAMMAYVERKYGSKRPPAEILIKELASIAHDVS